MSHNIIRFSDQSSDSLVETIDNIVAEPSVTLVCDMDELEKALDSKGYQSILTGGDIAYGCLLAANRIGRLSRVIVAVRDFKCEQEMRIWKRSNIQPIHPSPNASVEALVAQEVTESLNDNPSTIYLFVGSSSRYLDLMLLCREKGRILGAITPINMHKANAIREISRFILDLDEVIRLEQDVDIDNYDFTDFISLMKKQEDRLSFVGVQYFIERKMPRGLNLGSLKTCHRVFHKAKEEGIVELGTTPNTTEGGKEVATCKLNLNNELVQEVLARLEA